MENQNTTTILDNDAAVFSTVYTRLTPPLAVESFFFGVATTLVLIWAYRDIFLNPQNSAWGLQSPLISACGLYGVLTLHWALSMHGYMSIFSELASIASDAGLGNAPNLFASGDFSKFIPFISETVVFGASSCLFILASHLAFRRQRPSPGRNYGHIALGIAGTMYLLSATHWAIDLASTTTWYLWDREFDLRLWQSSGTMVPAGYVGAEVALISVNTILSDSIVLWRMWILWNRNRYLLWMSATIITFTSATSIANIITINRISGALTDDFETKNLPALPVFSYGTWGIVTIVSSLASNLVATCLIALKAWMHRRMIAESFKLGTYRTMTERVMSILVESGAIYCCIWIAWIIGSLGVGSIEVPSEQVVDRTSLGWGELVRVPAPANPFVDNMNVTMAQVTTIYPTLILILVALERTHCDHGFMLGAPGTAPSQENAIAPTLHISMNSVVSGNCAQGQRASAQPCDTSGDTESCSSDEMRCIEKLTP